MSAPAHLEDAELAIVGADKWREQAIKLLNGHDEIPADWRALVISILSVSAELAAYNARVSWVLSLIPVRAVEDVIRRSIKQALKRFE